MRERSFMQKHGEFTRGKGKTRIVPVNWEASFFCPWHVTLVSNELLDSQGRCGHGEVLLLSVAVQNVD